MGWSYGGYAALQAPIVSADTYKCSIAGAAVSNMPSFMIYQRKYTGYRRYKDYIKSDETSLNDISPYHHMDKLKLPVLMFHGEKDRRVPFKQSIKFVDEMKSQGNNIKFVNLESADHHLSREKDRVLYLQEVESFLKEHL
jgi:dipeptidyl aminopeptidase/acylaminoacyl peptidase